MGTAKSDDESDVSAHPLAENRPGVYVQVVAHRRRKKNKRGESASSSQPPAGKARGGVREETDARVRARRRSDPRVAESDDSTPVVSSVPPLSMSDAEPADLSGPPSAPTVVGRSPVPDMGVDPAADPELTVAGNAAEETEEDDGRQSGERPVDFDSMRSGVGASDNTNQRADLLGVSIPPPPRLPSFGHALVPGERDGAVPAPIRSSASLLDAPPTLRPGAPESTHAARVSATLLAFVAAFTAIIVAAGLVALRELTKGDEPAARETRAAIAAPADPAPAVVPAPTPPAAAAASTAASAEPAPEGAPTPAALPAPAPVPSSAVAPRARARLAAAKKAAPGRALVAKANAALRQLSNTGIKATPQGEPEPELEAEEEGEGEEEERAPNPGEPLELPFNPY